MSHSSRRHALQSGTSLSYILDYWPRLIELVSDGTATTVEELRAAIEGDARRDLENRACEILRVGELDGGLFGMWVREVGVEGIDSDDPLDALVAVLDEEDGLRKAKAVLKKAKGAPSYKPFTFTLHNFEVLPEQTLPSIETLVQRLEILLRQDYDRGHTVKYECNLRPGTYVVLAWSNRGRRPTPVIDGGIAERHLERGAKAIRCFIDFNEQFVAVEARALSENRWLERITEALQPEVKLSQAPSAICNYDGITADNLLTAVDTIKKPISANDVEGIQLVKIQWKRPNSPDRLSLSSPGGVQHYLRGLLEERARIQKLEFRVTMSDGQVNLVEVAPSAIKIDQLFFPRIWDFLSTWGIIHAR